MKISSDQNWTRPENHWISLCFSIMCPSLDPSNKYSTESEIRKDYDISRKRIKWKILRNFDCKPKEETDRAKESTFSKLNPCTTLQYIHQLTKTRYDLLKILRFYYQLFYQKGKFFKSQIVKIPRHSFELLEAMQWFTFWIALDSLQDFLWIKHFVGKIKIRKGGVKVSQHPL